MLILSVLWEKYHNINAAFQAVDPRVSHYFFQRSPFNIVIVCLAYWIFVKKIGPKMMEPLRPFELKKVLLVYNLIQIFSNGYVTYMGLRVLFVDKFYKDWTCMIAERTNADRPVADLGYIYVLLKVLDLLDTVFMVLRKSYRQITFLHFYHHLTMAVIGPITFQYFGGGHLVPFGVMNCFVHVVMYSYYFLSAVSSSVKKALWWKKYLTRLQIIQFLLIFVHLLVGFLNPSCSFSKPFLLVGLLQNLAMLVMFTKFYINTYIKIKNNKNKLEGQKTS